MRDVNKLPFQSPPRPKGHLPLLSRLRVGCLQTTLSQILVFHNPTICPLLCRSSMMELLLMSPIFPQEQPPIPSVPIPLSNTLDPQKFLLLATEEETLLAKRAVEDVPVPVSSIAPGTVSSFGLLVFSNKWFERPTSVLSSSKLDFVHRCLQLRSGRSFSFGSLNSRSFEGTYQHTRNEGSFSCTVSFSVPTEEKSLVLTSDNTHSGGLFAKPMGKSMLRTVPPSLQSPSSTDCSSSLTPVNTKRELLQSVFQAITLQWGSPHVDLFATSLNYKVQVFMSPVPDPKANAVDWMSVPWDGMFADAFPLSDFCRKFFGKSQQSKG
ncbi:unnamed protein product [Mytilus edulis]|uniref:Uncharacterized protein n=1 Tax=Mytilus edulis TaxID=6550 RepID=A0A8S3SX21_MYTED|nr:unnamed protein product [Mytilus edulis]